MSRILVVDNHDSFVFTLVDYLQLLGADVDLVEADAIDDPSVALAGYDGVLVSPGPGRPEDAGASVAVIRTAADIGMPVLGVCLGHQAVAVAFGGTVDHASELMHGMTSAVHHDGAGVFEGLPEPFTAGRYHSLAVMPGLPAVLRVTARTDAGTIMGIAHRTAPIAGVQFHPESVLTDGGHRLLGNWLARTGMADAPARGAVLHPLR